MKRTVLYLFVASLAFIGGCRVTSDSDSKSHSNPNGPTGPGGASCDQIVSLAVTSATGTVIPVGGSKQVVATGNDGVCTGFAVTWSTSNAGVATVSSTGLVTGVSVGSVVITATLVANPAITALLSMQVVAAPTTITVTSANPTLLLCTNGVGNTSYKIQTNPADTFDNHLVVSTVNNQNVEVDTHGVIIPHVVGSSIVQVLPANTLQVIGTFNVTVTATGCPTGLTGLTITPTNPTPGLALNGNGVCAASVQFTAGNVAASPTLVWSATGGNTTQNGLFTATQAGPASITATQGDRTVTVTFNVAQNGCVPTSSYTASLSGSGLQYCPNTTGGTTGQIVLTPPDATVTYSNNGSTFFTVNSSGKITPTGLGDGTVTVTGTGVYAGTNFTFPVHVGNNLCGSSNSPSITVTPNPLNMHQQDIGTLTANLVNITGTPGWTSTLGCVKITSVSGNTANVQSLQICRDSVVASIGTVKGYAIVNVTSVSTNCTIGGPFDFLVSQSQSMHADCGTTNPFWFSHDPSVFTIVGAPFVCVYDNVGFPCGPTATIKAIAVGSTSVCVQPSPIDHTREACQTETATASTLGDFIPNDGKLGYELKVPLRPRPNAKFQGIVRTEDWIKIHPEALASSK